MTKTGFLAFLATAALTTTLTPRAFAAPAPTRPKPAAHWNQTLQSGLALAKKTHKPILLDLFTTWCEPCKIMDTKVYTDPLFVKESKKWVLVKLDAENGKTNVAIAKKYKAEFFPTLLFLKPNGQEASRLVGFYTADLLVPKMRKASVKALKR